MCCCFYVSLCLSPLGELQAVSLRVLLLMALATVSQIWCVLCLVSALVKKRNLCFHSPMGGDVSCDPYYGVNLLWCIMAHSIKAYFISSL